MMFIGALFVESVYRSIFLFFLLNPCCGCRCKNGRRSCYPIWCCEASDDGEDSKLNHSINKHFELGKEEADDDDDDMDKSYGEMFCLDSGNAESGSDVSDEEGGLHARSLSAA